MTLRHYEILEAVARTGNFTRAAEELFITQSAVSHAVKELEQAVGMPLFDRTSRQVRLTRSGQLLLEESLPILAACRQLDARIDSLEQRAAIRLVSSITVASFYLPSLLNEYKKLQPDIPVSVQVVPAMQAVQILREGNADIALVEGALQTGPFCTKVFGAYTLLMVCSPDYPAAGKVLTIAELCAQKLLLREKGSASRDTLDSALYLSGYSVYPAWCSVNSTALLAAAKAGLGIAVLPDLLVQDALKEGTLASVTVPSLLLHNRMLALWHQDKYLGQPLLLLLSLMKESAAAPDNPSTAQIP